jgi:ribosomal protein S8
MTKLHLAACLALQRQGLISTVTVAGKYPPASIPVLPTERKAVADHLRQQPWDAYVDPSKRVEPDRDPQTLPANPADRRIWIGLKYWRGKPVLSKAQMVSKPTRRVTVPFDSLHNIVKGLPPKKSIGRNPNIPRAFVKGLVNPGECLFIKTTDGILESRECLEKRLGGMVLFRTL